MREDHRCQGEDHLLTLTESKDISDERKKRNWSGYSLGNQSIACMTKKKIKIVAFSHSNQFLIVSGRSFSQMIKKQDKIMSRLT